MHCRNTPCCHFKTHYIRNILAKPPEPLHAHVTHCYTHSCSPSTKYCLQVADTSPQAPPTPSHSSKSFLYLASLTSSLRQHERWAHGLQNFGGRVSMWAIITMKRCLRNNHNSKMKNTAVRSSARKYVATTGTHTP